MAFLNTATAAGLAYRHDYKGWNDEMARQEQLNMVKKAADQQRAGWIADKMKLGKTWTDFDSKGLQGMAQEKFKDIAKILNDNPNWESDPNAIAQVNMISEQLLDNDYVRRSKMVYDNYQRLTKDMSNPDLVEDDEVRAQMQDYLNKYQNYNKHGNIEGIEGAPVNEFAYMTPTVFDVAKSFDEIAKNTGVQEIPWETATREGTQQVVKNLDEVTRTYLTGKDGDRFIKEFSKYRANGGTTKSINQWFKENINNRKDTGMTSRTKPTGGDGDGNKDGYVYDLWNDGVAPNYMAAKENSLRNKDVPFTVHVSEAGKFLPFAQVDDRGRGNVTVPNGTGILVMSPDGKKATSLDTYEGKNLQVKSMGKIVLRNGKPYVEAVALLDRSNSEVRDKLMNDEDYFQFTGIEPGEWKPKGEYGDIKVVRDEAGKENTSGYNDIEATVYLPADISTQTIQNWTSKTQGEATANKLGAIRQQRNVNLRNLATESGAVAGGPKLKITKGGRSALIWIDEKNVAHFEPTR
jgi:hypothetical protein